MPYNHNSVKCEHFTAGKQGPKSMLKHKTNSRQYVTGLSREQQHLSVLKPLKLKDYLRY